MNADPPSPFYKILNLIISSNFQTFQVYLQPGNFFGKKKTWSLKVLKNSLSHHEIIPASLKKIQILVLRS